MGRLIIFIAGLIYGWLFEWLLENFKQKGKQTDVDVSTLKEQVLRLEAENVQLRKTIEKLRKPSLKAGGGTKKASVENKKDDLTKIKGVGPVLAKTLNEAGIMTFSALASLTPAELEGMLTGRLKNLADEAQIISAANDLSGK